MKLESSRPLPTTKLVDAGAVVPFHELDVLSAVAILPGIVLLATYQFGVRYTPISVMLNGKRARVVR